MTDNNQLISYIEPGAPATRRPADGNESFVRPCLVNMISQTATADAGGKGSVDKWKTWAERAQVFPYPRMTKEGGSRL